MHQLKVLAFGSDNFISTLVELKPYLKFNLFHENDNLDQNLIKFDVLFIQEEVLKIEKIKNLIKKYNSIKILASYKENKNNSYDSILKLPTTLNEINSIIQSSAAKKKFSKNASIKINEYMLDKNEKKLFKKNKFIILTEKEIQLLELFSNTKKPVTKNEILSLVWHYAPDADTHTVETHIYRLRKKIHSKFLDENFILNNKDGYCL
jgi:uncharacterized membrane-anchored protein YjiN (DUF445 family)|tara:strand:+ start:1914 stop:2534 length:621 start_codon:yes stop_codon:yes gene_type:complete